MAKKVAVVVVEFDDPEENFETAADFATYVDIVMHELRGKDVTVYVNPEELVLDTEEGNTPFSDGRQDRPALLGRVQDQAPKA